MAPNETSIDPKFIKSTLELEAVESKRVWKAVTQYSENPDNPGLNPEKLGGRAGRSRLWSIRASQELRILLAREGSVTVFLRAGHHDEIYALAERSTFIAPAEGGAGLIPLRPGAVDLDGGSIEWANLPHVEESEAKSKTVLEHWATPELAAAGFTPDEIKLLREAGINELLDIWPDIQEQQFNLVLELAELTPEQWKNQQLIEDQEAAERRFRAAVVDRGALSGLSSVLSPEEVVRLASAPIEDWMIFLHPDQRALVNRRFNGPARVRGSAGTGKTVVALHRAAALAKRVNDERKLDQRPVLFTTFVNSLPPVFENLYFRLPSAVRGIVEFTNVDKLAYRICKEAGRRPNLRPGIVDAEFSRALEDVVQPGTPLHNAQLTSGYLRDEVTKVIKGRGVDTVDEYLSMERTGRRTPFSEAMRRQTWKLHEAWDLRMAQRGVVDFPDVVRRARDIALTHAEPMFSHAVIDESQDLTLVGLQLVRTLVNGPSEADIADGLFIVGDGAQKIYAGGFTLAQAGVDVRGNSTVLHVNYRNTQQIIETAFACTGKEEVNDLGDVYARGDAVADASREGAGPVLVVASDFDSQVSYVADQVKRIVKAGTLGFGDVCVCAPTNRLVRKTMSQLTAAGLQTQDLARFEGRTNDLVKVGNFFRAKGLEFKVVFLLGLSADEFPTPQRQGQSDAEFADQRSLQVSQLFVAMTRARDRFFVLCDGEPSDLVRDAMQHFELVES
ncbi:MAG: UvrD-helicase domain-containing protein [bacterium]|nr:UvrD-helicase domain-containing protein [bacterium]